MIQTLWMWMDSTKLPILPGQFSPVNFFFLYHYDSEERVGVLWYNINIILFLFSDFFHCIVFCFLKLRIVSKNKYYTVNLYIIPEA